jgi:2-polyprenyl-6-methoxyphenol hydroxylase-like FAD-dependent oxidoreductase
MAFTNNVMMVDSESKQGSSSRNSKRRKRSSSTASSRWDKESTQIVIVGAGLAGLAAAIALEEAGFTNLCLYERDVSPDSASSSSIRRGYGLTLSYNPKGPLQKLNHNNILEQVAQKDCPSRAHYVLAPDGTILGYYGHAFYKKQDKAWGHRQRGNLRIPRHELRQILMEQVKSPIYWNKRLLSMKVMLNDDNALTESTSVTQTRKLELTFEDGTVVSNVDLLVAADGLRSKVVSSIVPSSDLHYLGVVLILGIADYCHALLDERGFYTLDGNHRLFTMPYQGSRLDPNVTRRVMWQLSFQLDDLTQAQTITKGGPEALRDEVLRRCKDWHTPVIDMIRATPFETIWGT